MRYIILLMTCFLLFTCARNTERKPLLDTPIIYKSDLETVTEKNDELLFSTSEEGIFLKNAQAQTSEFSRSGNHSIKLDATNEYGLNFRIKNLEKGEFYRVSAWQKKGELKGALVVRVNGENYYRKYKSHYSAKIHEDEDWILHNVTFVLEEDCEQMDVFAFSGGRDAYYDDFEVQRFKQIPANLLDTEVLRISVQDSTKNQLNEMITTALNAGLIPNSSKTNVRPFLLEKEDSVQIKMKLKGDFTDHLESGKTSYRIKLSGDYAFKGLKEFSIQHAKTRNYLHEWVIHKWAEKEDVLTTRYDFSNVIINNVPLGLYAVEEHFVKQLLEAQERREGPILKFDESGAWAYNYALPNYENKAKLPFFQASTILPFKKNKTKSNPGLKRGFHEGKILLNLFKTGHLDLEDVFDLEQLAKFYVMIELSGNDHGLAWHNRRFYYNPVTQKLEHILFDVLPFYDHFSFQNILLSKLKAKKGLPENVFDETILFNQEFKENYLYYLEKYTQKDYLDSTFLAMENQLLVFQNAIQIEEPFFQFNKEIYYENAIFQRNVLGELNEVWENEIANSSLENEKSKEEFQGREDCLFIPEIGINAYMKKSNQLYEIEVENYHVNNINLLGYQEKKSDSIIVFDQPVKMNQYSDKCSRKVFVLNKKPKKIFFTIDNNPALILSEKILPWEKPEGETSRMALEKAFNPNESYFRRQKNKIELRGNVVIDKPILIPENFEVVILPGTEIEFKTGGGLIITNSCYAQGSSSQPIHIFCNDSTSNGITVLNGKEAIFEYVSFEGLSNLHHENWVLTGAVTIYETKAKLLNCSISGNLSEDALNIIRSQFDIMHLSVENTFSDGFDADFCQGNIRASTFKNTGNDCIDFSGSTVQIVQIEIENSGDKGISGGEQSNLKLDGIIINGAKTGIASKDGSVIEGRNITIENSELMCAAFKKKPEYPVARIKLDEINFAYSETTVLIDLGSTVELNGKYYEGNKRVDIESLYAEFQK